MTSRPRAFSMRTQWVPKVSDIPLQSSSTDDIRVLETAGGDSGEEHLSVSGSGWRKSSALKVSGRKSVDLGSLLVDVSSSALLGAVWEGQEAEMERILNENPESINDRDPNRGTLATLLAAQWQSEKGVRMMKKLINRSADITLANNFGNNPLNRAALCSPTVALYLCEHILANDIKVSKFDGPEHFNALHYASQCVSKEHEAVKMLITTLVTRLGMSPNAATGDSGCTPLHFAVELELTHVVETLLDHKADANKCRLDGCTPLHMCAQRGNVEMLKLLVSKGNGDLTVSGPFGTALNLATVAGKEDMVRYLIEQGLDPNANFPLGTAVYAACDKGQLGCLKVLIEHGGAKSVNTVPLRDGSIKPMLMATYKGYSEIVRILLKHGAVAPENNRHIDSLLLAAQRGNDEIVSMLLDASFDINRVMSKIGAPLHAACLRGHLSTAELLIKRGADVTLNTPCGTPVYSASEKGHAECLRLLLKHGAASVLETMPAKERTQSSLMMAIQQGHNHIVQILLSHGANPDTTRFDGITPLYFACNKNKVECARSLLLAGANPNARIKSGAFPLYIAAQNGFLDIVRELLAAGANKYLTYKGFGTPERIATKRKHSECAELITEYAYPSETAGWDPDNSATECRACGTPFSFTNRKHHCRDCKHIFCADCTTKKKLVYGLAHLGDIKVCDDCWVSNNPSRVKVKST